MGERALVFWFYLPNDTWYRFRYRIWQLHQLFSITLRQKTPALPRWMNSFSTLTTRTVRALVKILMLHWDFFFRFGRSGCISDLQIWYPKIVSFKFSANPQGHRILVGPYNKKTQKPQSPVPFRKKKRYASPLWKRVPESLQVNHLWSKVGKNSANREPQGPSCGVYKPQTVPGGRILYTFMMKYVKQAYLKWYDWNSVSPICGMSLMCAFHILSLLDKVAYIFCIDHLLQYQSLSQWLVHPLPPTVPPTEEIWP